MAVAYVTKCQLLLEKTGGDIKLRKVRKTRELRDKLVKITCLKTPVS